MILDGMFLDFDLAQGSVPRAMGDIHVPLFQVTERLALGETIIWTPLRSDERMKFVLWMATSGWVR